MKYVASASIKMQNPEMNSGEWTVISNTDSVETKWRVLEGRTIQVVSGLFDTYEEALERAQHMYTNMLFDILNSDNIISNAGCEYEFGQFIGFRKHGDAERLFLVSATSSGKCQHGVCVFEVERDIAEIDKISFLDLPIEVQNFTSHHIDFAGIIEPHFEYTENTQPIFDLLVRANKAVDYNQEMADYCTLLEYLANKEGFGPLKPEPILHMVDQFIEQTQNASLTEEDVNILLGGLKTIRELGPKNKVIMLVQKYGQPEYNGITANQIISEAYSYRSQYDHSGTRTPRKIKKSIWMKMLVFDVVKNYLHASNEQ